MLPNKQQIEMEIKRIKASIKQATEVAHLKSIYTQFSELKIKNRFKEHHTTVMLLTAENEILELLINKQHQMKSTDQLKQEMLDNFQQVNPETIWGTIARNFCDNINGKSEHDCLSLIKELQQAIRDNREMMEGVLGMQAFQYVKTFSYVQDPSVSTQGNNSNNFYS